MDNTTLEYAWTFDTQEVLSAVETSESGLSDTEAHERLRRYGKNTFSRREKKSVVGIFIKQLGSPLIFILIAAGVLTGLLQEWLEVVVIFIAVFANAGLGFFREYHAESTLEKLSTFIKDRTRVFRDGKEQEIDSELVVVGDIIKLAYGTRVPADARLIQVNNVRIDEAVLTGESIHVAKRIETVERTAPLGERSNMVHAGTLVVEGFGTAVVVATGDATQIGTIAGLVSATHRAHTPLQKGLSKLAWVILGIVLVIVIGIFILGVSRGEPLFAMLVLSAAVSVGAVPEALPIALTVILSIGAERIAKKRGITRTLIAAETLGSTSLIMTDKTGTLTEANMQLVGMYTLNDVLTGTDSADDSRLLDMALVNTDVLVENPDAPMSQWTFAGKPFEVNIAKLATQRGINVITLKAAGKVESVIPFNSTHKFSVSKHNNEYVVMGAPDILLARSTLSASEYKAVEDWIAAASSAGKRLIALGTTKSAHSIDSVAHISFAGILAFFDPVRKAVPAAIKRIESLGVQVVMITGDLKGTALSVAKEIGWEIGEREILTGQELQTLSDEALLTLLPNTKVFARVTPEDKLRIGEIYRTLGEVVAMTGDGVNDAPSLKAMDIGVAIGSGSDVAKSAADIVLLDDNFETITLAIQEGRRILANIRKTFIYLMSNSLDEVCVIGGSLLLELPLPLTAIQIIWVNLFTGSLPALSFAYDEDFDHESTKRHTLKSIFTKEANVLTFGLGIASSLLLFIMYWGLLSIGVPIGEAQTVFFICFASYILVIAYSFRSLHRPLFAYPVFSNRKLNQSILLAVALLVATVAIPQVRDLFGLVAVGAAWIWFVLAWLILNMLIVEIAKYFFRRAR